MAKSARADVVAKVLGGTHLDEGSNIKRITATQTHSVSRKVVIKAELTAGNKSHAVTVEHVQYTGFNLGLARDLCGRGSRATGYSYTITAQIGSHPAFSAVQGNLTLAASYKSSSDYRVQGVLKGSATIAAPDSSAEFTGLNISSYCGSPPIAVLGREIEHESCQPDMVFHSTAGTLKLPVFVHSMAMTRSSVRISNHSIEAEIQAALPGLGGISSSTRITRRAGSAVAIQSSLVVRVGLKLSSLPQLAALAGDGVGGLLPHMAGGQQMMLTSTDDGHNVLDIPADSLCQQQLLPSGPPSSARVLKASFDLTAKTMSVHTKLAGGPVFTAAMSHMTAASFEATETTIELSATAARISGHAQLDLGCLGQIATRFHGELGGAGLRLLARGTGQVGRHPASVFMVAQQGTGMATILCAMSFTEEVALQAIPSLAGLAGVGAMPPLRGGSTIAIATMPQNGTATHRLATSTLEDLFSMADGESDTAASSLSLVQAQDTVFSLGLPRIHAPMSGIFVSATLAEKRNFGGRLAALNQLVDLSGRGIAKTKLTGYINPASGDYHMRIEPGATLTVQAPPIGGMQVGSMELSIVMVGSKLQASFTGEGSAVVSQVRTLRTHAPVTVSGQLKEDGMLEMTAHGKLTFEEKEADVVFRMARDVLGSSAIKASVLLQAPRVALQQLVRVPDSVSVKYITDATVLYSNHDIAAEAEGTLHAGASITGTVSDMDGDELLKPLREAFTMRNETGTVLTGWFPISPDGGATAQDFVLRASVGASVSKVVHVNEDELFNVTLDAPHARLWSVQGHIYNTFHSAGQISSLSVTASFPDAALRFFRSGGFKVPPP